MLHTEQLVFHKTSVRSKMSWLRWWEVVLLLSSALPQTAHRGFFFLSHFPLAKTLITDHHPMFGQPNAFNVEQLQMFGLHELWVNTALIQLCQHWHWYQWDIIKELRNSRLYERLVSCESLFLARAIWMWNNGLIILNVNTVHWMAIF